MPMFRCSFSFVCDFSMWASYPCDKSRHFSTSLTSTCGSQYASHSLQTPTSISSNSLRTHSPSTSNIHWLEFSSHALIHHRRDLLDIERRIPWSDGMQDIVEAMAAREKLLCNPRGCRIWSWMDGWNEDDDDRGGKWSRGWKARSIHR